MHSSSIKTTFRTLVTETGTGTQCVAELPLRIDPAEQKPRVFFGAGYGVDGLSARLAAEGEAMERATWYAGGLWNNAFYTEDPYELPDEAKLFLSLKQLKRLTHKPCTAIQARNHAGKTVWIPSEAVFFYPLRAHDLRHFSVTTGWAYHLSKESAAAQSYREVIERNLLMLFWYGRLAPYLHRLTQTQVQDWGLSSGLLTDNEPLRVYQASFRIPQRFGGQAHFTLVLHTSAETPYLSVGSALKPNSQQSFCSAIGEYQMVRAYRHDQLLGGRTKAPDTEFTAHTLYSNRDPVTRDTTTNLLKDSGMLDALKEPRLDYRRHPYWVVYFKPPPLIPYGVVSKVWVDGCQPMVPAGIRCGLVERWLSDWNITEEQWMKKRWHPFP